MKNRILKIAFFGHRLDSSNLGVDALTHSHLAILSAEACRLNISIEVDIYAGLQTLPAINISKYVVAQQFPQPIFPKRMISNYLEIPRKFRQYIAVFDLSEGDSFADIYGWRRAYINSMQRILAARAGCPVIVAPMTIGPFKSWVWQRLAARSLRVSSAVFARDVKSAQVARSLGCDEVQLATDLAMELPYTRLEHQSDNDDSLHIGVNVSGLLWSGGYTSKNEFGIHADYRATTIAIVERLLQEPNIELHLVPHVLSVGKVEDDRIPSEELKLQFPACRIAPKFGDSIAAKNYISGLDLFMGARMHACIAAFSSGVPTLPLAYSMKFEGLFGSLGYDRTVDLCSASKQEVLDALERALRERQQMKAEVSSAFEKADALLNDYRAVVSEILKGATV